MSGNNPRRPWQEWARPNATKSPPLKRYNVGYFSNDDTTLRSGPHHARSSGFVRRARDAGRIRATSDAFQPDLVGEAHSDSGDSSETDDVSEDASIYSEYELTKAEQEIERGIDLALEQHEQQKAPHIDFQVRPSTSGYVKIRDDPGPSSDILFSRGKRGRYERLEPSVRANYGVERATHCVPRPSAHSTKTGKDKDMGWLVQGRMPGGPADGSVIPSFGGHIAACIRKGPRFERETLRTYNRGTTFVQLQNWMQSLSSEARDLVHGSGLSHLHEIMMPYIDAPLISAFVERWQPDTNTFHMPFGEMTILLHDVSAILRIPIDGDMVSSTGATHKDSQIDLYHHIWELLQLTMDELSPKALWDNGGISVEKIFDACWRKKKKVPDVEACGFLLVVLGTTLFANKSDDHILLANILEVKTNLRGVNNYSWGSATLAYLYRQLGLASRSECTDIAGCLTLMQAWIYEYFPCFRPHKKCSAIFPGDARAALWDPCKSSMDFHRLQSYRFQIDQLTACKVNWLPYGPYPETLGQRTLIPGWVGYREILEPYLPDRVVRQFGYIQGIPDPIPQPLLVRRPSCVKSYNLIFSRPTVLSHWNSRSSLKLLNFKDIPRIDSQEAAPFGPTWCTDDYMDWYETYSHPRVIPDNALAVSRANTDYWVNYAIDCMRGLMLKYPDKKSEEYVRCEQFISDWQLAEYQGFPNLF